MKRWVRDEVSLNSFTNAVKARSYLAWVSCGAAKAVGLALLLGFGEGLVAAPPTELASHLIKIQHHYLWLPIKPGAERRWVSLKREGETVRQFSIELAGDTSNQWVASDVSAFIGKELLVECELPPGATLLEAIRQSDGLPHADAFYREELRPQFHFTSRIGRLNDPNGLVFLDGEYHLFYQHNPFGIISTNKSWGHAVSTDLLHWRELDTAIHPDARGLIYSGSAVVDGAGTTGFVPAGSDVKPLVAIYTSGGGTFDFPWAEGLPCTQSIAWSTDHGRTFTVYPGNPVLPEVHPNNRDPKVFWHDPTRRWIMVLYLARGQFGVFASPDLKHWEKQSDLLLPDGYECPDLFPLPVDGNPAEVRWVAWEAKGRYLVGDFDGKNFTAESGLHQSRYEGNEYAAQTFNHLPAGRVVQMAWIRSRNYSGVSFSQQMTIPRELTLRSTDEGARVFIEPVKEVTSLREGVCTQSDIQLNASVWPISSLDGERSFDLEMEFLPGSAKRVGLKLLGGTIEYDVAAGELVVLGKRAPLQLVDGRIKLRVLVDRVSYEVFANDGQVQMAALLAPNLVLKNDICGLYAEGGAAVVVTLKTWRMRSVWSDDSEFIATSLDASGRSSLRFYRNADVLGNKASLKRENLTRGERPALGYSGANTAIVTSDPDLMEWAE